MANLGEILHSNSWQITLVSMRAAIYTFAGAKDYSMGLLLDVISQPLQKGSLSAMCSCAELIQSDASYIWDMPSIGLVTPCATYYTYVSTLLSSVVWRYIIAGSASNIAAAAVSGSQVSRGAAQIHDATCCAAAARKRQSMTVEDMVTLRGTIGGAEWEPPLGSSCKQQFPDVILQS